MSRPPRRRQGLDDFERRLADGGGALATAAGLRPSGPVRVARVSRRAGRWSAADLQVPQADGRAITIVALATDSELPDGLVEIDLTEARRSDPSWSGMSQDVHVATFPLVHDPRLPGLATASSLARLGRLLGRPVVRIERHRYRHLQRAVLRAIHANGDVVWVKVLDPPRAAPLAARHAAMAPVVRVPEVVALDGRLGLVACRHLHGAPLRDLVRAPSAPDARVWPRAIDLLELPAAVADAATDRPTPRTPPLEALPRHARALAGVLPEAADRVGALVRRVSTLAEEARRPAARRTTVHGDLHAAQVVCGDLATDLPPGLLDLDDVGWGDPLDDRCRLLGHLVGTVETAPTPHGRALVRELTTRLVGHEGDAAVARVAAVLLGQALGPHRASQHGWRPHSLHRLRTAERWSRGDVRLRPV